MRAVRAAAVVLVVALLGLLVWDVARGSSGGIAAKVDKGETVKAPNVKLPWFGKPGDFDLAAYRGKVVVLNFWASWCVDCKLEAKTLHDAAAKWKGKDVVFIGVDTKDFDFAASTYMKRYAMNYPVVRDVSGHLGTTFGVTGYPETFIVDRQGEVVPPHVDGPIVSAAAFSPAELNKTIARLSS
ncbi:MAG TPA: TlpA disulfide reductase family protein [Gaiellaceae bacterium]|nr:TlpA disulfide reductase family protein [Gaiellaceae bacterium]